MATNYDLPKPTAGTPRAGEEVSLMADVSDTVADIDTRITAKAPIESPALTGTPTVPTAPAGTNTTQAASTAFVGTAVAALIGAPLAPGWYYGTPAASVSAVALGQSTLHLTPFVVGKAGTLDRIAAEVTTAAASSTIRLGIYEDTDGLPGDLLLDAGTRDSSTTGVKSIPISQAVTAGVYWLAAVSQGGAPTVRTIAGPGGFQVGRNTETLSVPYTALTKAAVTGELPATVTPDGSGSTAHRVVVRAA